ncbi:MAG TPA: ABC transporter permease, partial [Acidimicrobiales bacterium]|nr:ABC transporter permease [Acidimicrobiales bacterium]
VPPGLPGASTRESRPALAWAAFFLRRLVRLALSLLALVTATFAMIHLLPGNPVRAALGEDTPPAVVTARIHQLGLDRPIVDQYLSYLHGVLTGNLGESIVSSEPVSTILGGRILATLSLAIPAFALVLLVSLPLGLLMALRTRGGRGERTRLAFVGITGLVNSVPDFVWATVLSASFVIGLRLFPAAGDTGVKSHILPVIALTLGPIASLSRIVRVEALEVLDSEYVRAARSRRLPARLLYLRHVLPNMVTASLTFSGMILSGLIAGTVLVENVFDWPGLGTEISQAVVQKDYPLIQGILLVLGAMVLAIHLVVDVILGIIDPRSRIMES